uniref:SOCS box domain-containing protein n=2 Tax=Acrobeloides nanus TaxID=290746 RepID=A0A914C6S9_9BILA
MPALAYNNIVLPVDDPTLAKDEQQQMMQRLLADKISGYAGIEELRFLLVSGAQADGVVTQGLTPLHYACYRDYFSAAKLLLVRGAKVNALDEVGYSALHLCAEQGNYRLIKLLLEYMARVCYVEPKDLQKDFPVRESVDEPLRLAIRRGHYDCAKLLLENGADPNARYFDGPEITQISPLDTDFLELLLKFGADPNVYCRDGLTPLMKACRHREKGIKAIEVLLNHGADINAFAMAKQDLRTPLHYAVLSGCVPLIAYLLENGADINMPKGYEKPSVLDIAVLKDDPLLVQFLLDAGADPNAMHGCFGSALHIACCSEKENQYEMTKMLLEYGADVNLGGFDQDGRAFKSPLVEFLRPKDDSFPDPKILGLLLSYGGEIVMRQCQQDHRGQIRNVLPMLEKCPALGMHLLSSTHPDNVDVVAFERLCQAENVPQHVTEAILQFTREPRSLQQLCRLRLRSLMKPLRPEKVEQLPLPPFQKQYILGYF